ncbi:MAG: hypothetical protein ACTSYI_07920 [Promethearchaeota archaeon]
MAKQLKKLGPIFLTVGAIQYVLSTQDDHMLTLQGDLIPLDMISSAITSAI